MPAPVLQMLGSSGGELLPPPPNLPTPGAAPALAHSSAHLPALTRASVVPSPRDHHCQTRGVAQSRAEAPPFGSFLPTPGAGNTGSVLHDPPHCRGELSRMLGRLHGK